MAEYQEFLNIYIKFLRENFSNKYLADMPNAVVLGDAFIKNTYIAVFKIDESEAA